MLRRVLAVAFFTVALIAHGSTAPLLADDLTRNRLEADIRFLASDALRGRGTPSPEVDIAAEYLAAQLRAAGWKPANEGSYLQTYGISSYVPSKGRATVKQDIVVKEDQQPSWRVSYLTDSYHFARFDVPNVEFFTGLHDDYHQAGDDADKIHFDELSRIMNVMYDVARAYADGAPKPSIVRPEWFVIPQ